MTAPVGWDDVQTARVYERFCRRHRRYRVANDALIAYAALVPGLRVLDVAAGTGRTAEAVLPHIGDRGTVLCVEPARAMRDVGARRLTDQRVAWTSQLPDENAALFDRVVCGAGMWQLLPLDSTFARLLPLLAPGGAMIFNIPAQYLLEPDPPGGGRDPLLLELPALVQRSVAPTSNAAALVGAAVLPRSSDEVDRLLVAAGLRTERWSFDLRLTQAAYRDWLKIPPVSEGMFAGLPLAEREQRLDDAYRRADRRSWRWERWIGWTAWRMN
jgi:SAM-dependent methyltransferase